MKYLICIAIAVLLFIVYVWFENKFLIVRKYNVKSEIIKGNKIKIVQLSDLHKKTYSDNWKKLCLKVKALNPDIIIISGDLVSRTHKSFEYTGKLVEKLCDICPVFYAKGNHELDLENKSSEYMEKLRETVVKNGANFLENKMMNADINGSTVNIYGADLKRSIYRNSKGGFSNLESCTAEELEEIFGKPQGFSILIAHNPFFFSEYAKWGADITFSGHVHAGIVNTPFGGILSPERKFFPKYTKGIYEYGDKKMIVSAGIGKLRIFNPSEILYLEIEK